MKSGFISIVGRPNVGKSTLLNDLVEMKLAITSDKVQTTRNIIQGVYRDEETEIVFVDTPGIHKPKYKLGNLLNQQAWQTVHNVDAILFVIDGNQGFGKGDRFILKRIKDNDIPIILVINKVDQIKKDHLLEMIKEISEEHEFAEIVPTSALKSDNTKRLLEVVKNYLTNDVPLFDENTVTNITTNFYVAETVREKVLNLTKEEVPHAVTCYVEDIKEKKNLVEIMVLIVVDRANLKNILIGKQGKMIKEIGRLARIDLEEYFNKKVYLETHVKVIDNWRDEMEFLKEQGLKE